MKCFQIELKYINEHNQEVGVTVVSDPMPIGLSVNKDNENKVISDVLQYIYENPDTAGHNELLTALQQATTLNQINLYEQPLNLIGSQSGIKFSKEDVKPSNSEKIANKFTFLDLKDSNEVSDLLNTLTINDSATAFKTKVYEITGYINPETKMISGVLDDVSKHSWYDKDNATLFINPTVNTTRSILDLKEALMNSLLPKSETKSISDLAKEESFNPLILGTDMKSVVGIIDTVTKLKEPTFKRGAVVRTVSASSLERLESTGKGVNVDTKSGKEHYGIPKEFLKGDTNPHIIASKYNLWLNGYTVFSDIEPERLKWINSKIQYGGLDTSVLLTNNQPHAEILKNYINTREVENTSFLDKLKSFVTKDENFGYMTNSKGDHLLKGTSPEIKDYVQNLSKWNSKNASREEVSFLNALKNLKDSDSSTTLERLLRDNFNIISDENGVEVLPGDVVEYAGNNYLFWKLNKGGKARLLDLTGKKYTGTPAVEKLNLVTKGKPFEYNKSSYISFGNEVYSLATGNKIKDLAILKKSAINAQTVLFSRMAPPKDLRNGFTYASDQKSKYDSHLKYRRTMTDQGSGSIRKFSELEARIEYNKLKNLLGDGALTNITHFKDAYDRDSWSFSVKSPVILETTIEQLREKDRIESERLAIINNTIAYNENWDNLTDLEKSVFDIDRYNEEISVLGSFSKTLPNGNDNSYEGYFNLSKVLTSKSLLEEVGKNRPFAKYLAETFGDSLLENVDVNAVTYNDLEKYKISEEDGMTYGAYIVDSKGKRSIELATDVGLPAGMHDDIIIHEALHAITNRHLSKNTEANKAFEALLEEVRTLLPETYALSSTDEFMSGIFTDRQLINDLKALESNDSNKTLFGKVLDFFSEMLNFGDANKRSFIKLMDKMFNFKYTNRNFFNESVNKANDVLSEISSAISSDMPTTKNYSKKDTNSSYRSSEDYMSATPINVKSNPKFSKTGSEKSNPVDRTLLKQFSKSLSEKYNLEIEHLNSSEINEEYSKNGIEYGKHRAFIENGKVVINTDYASFAEPLHELSHLILDGLKLTNNAVYNQLLTVVQSHPLYNNVRKTYPELSGNELAEETFVTVLGEHYNGTVVGEHSNTWNNNNSNFFKKAIKAIKNFFADLFGIDDFSFHRLSPIELMNLDLNTIMEKFSKNAIDGDFSREVDLALKKESLLQSGEYVMAKNGTASSFYGRLKNSELGETTASNLWLKTKTDNFDNWHRGDLNTEFDGEPRIFFRGNDPQTLHDLDPIGENDMVVVRGSLQDLGNRTYKAPSANIKSIFNLDSDTLLNRNSYSIENISELKGWKLVGKREELRYSANKLKDMFKDYTFAVQTFGDINFLQYYKTPIEEVVKMRELLLKNYSNINC